MCVFFSVAVVATAAAAVAVDVIVFASCTYLKRELPNGIISLNGDYVC